MTPPGYASATQVERDAWLVAAAPRAPQATEEEAVTPEARIRAALIVGDAIRDLEPPEPLVEGWLYRDSLAAIYGPSGDGKTFAALSIAGAVAAGIAWHNCEVSAGPVLYVVAEGAAGIGDRMGAWQTANGIPRCEKLTWLPMAVNLTRPEWTGALVAVVRDINPVLTMFDTTARMMVGADENSARDMGVVVAAADQIRRASHGCVALVHHSGKDFSAGMRGSSALRSAVDTEIEVRQVDSVITMRCTKQKNAVEPNPRQFHLKQVGASCVLEAYRGQPVADLLPRQLVEAVAALKSIELPEGVPSGAWKVACAVSDRSYYRARASLIDSGEVVNVGTDKQPRYKVAATATATANTANGSTKGDCLPLPHPLGVAAGSTQVPSEGVEW